MLKTLKHLLLPKLRQLQRDHSENFKISYSQCGEDIILQQLFMVLGITKVNYLDVGAHHPTYFSNTYLFYKNGGNGVCVEPDPSLFKSLGKKRPRDIHLNCGVGIMPSEADFFVMSTSTLNTFSKEEAERYQSYGQQRIMKTIRIKLETINEIIRQNFEKSPNLVSLDVEGFDYLILQHFDFNKYRPEVFCLETLSYTEDKSERKLTEIIELMHANDYLTYADTYINTIFVNAAVWNNRP
jgi:methyltransferase, FkbM family